MSELDRKAFLRLMTVGLASFLGRPVPLLGQTPDATAQQVDLTALHQKADLSVFSPSNSEASWARLKFPCTNGDWDDWNAHAQGDLNFLQHMNQTTSVSISSSLWNVANIDQLDEMIRYPFIFMHAEMPPELSATQIANMREYLLRGGFLFAEDCVRGKFHHNRGGGPDPDLFFTGIMDTMPKILPEAKIEKLPNDHPIYHCFYHMPNGLPMCQGQPHGGHGVMLNGRMVAFLSPHDNHCGWTYAPWFPAGVGDLALQMGTNLYVYAMTQNA